MQVIDHINVENKTFYHNKVQHLNFGYACVKVISKSLEQSKDKSPIYLHFSLTSVALIMYYNFCHRCSGPKKEILYLVNICDHIFCKRISVDL